MMPQGLKQWLPTLGALFAPGALIAVLVAGGVALLACDTPSSEACERQGLATFQFLVALVGLVPVVLLIRAVRRGELRQANVLFVLSVIVYETWALLNDAAVHGWDNLTLLP